MEAKTLNGNQSQSKSQPAASSSDSLASHNSNKTFLLQAIPATKKIMPDQDPNRTRNIWLRIEFMINMVNHVLIGFITIYLSWMCLRLELKKTALHAWLCTLGFVLLMAEGVMTHYNGNTVLFFYTRKTKTTIHWILQALGGCLGIAGGIVKIAEKEVHFTTIHGKTGFAAMILCAVSMLTGLSALYSQTLRRILQPLLNKTFHNLLGVGTLVIALVAQYYGYETGFFKRQVNDDFRIMMEVMTLIVLVFSCWGPLKALFEKLQNVARSF